jgi:hypothetical protein
MTVFILHLSINLRSFILHAPQQVIKSKKWHERRLWNVWGVGELRRGLWWRDPIERDLGVGGKFKMEHR